MANQGPTPFRINVPDSLLEATKEKLRDVGFPGELENVGWEGNYFNDVLLTCLDGTPLEAVERRKPLAQQI